MDLKAEVQPTPRLYELPFESRRKRMSTIHRVGVGPHQVAYVKGAPKEMLALCTRIQLNGRACPLHDELREQITVANDTYARDGLRVLAVAQRPCPNSLTDHTPEVVEAVEKCRRAGIRIIMITGDYGLTAESIAQRIGIIRGAQPFLQGAFGTAAFPLRHWLFLFAWTPSLLLADEVRKGLRRWWAARPEGKPAPSGGEP